MDLSEGLTDKESKVVPCRSFPSLTKRVLSFAEFYQMLCRQPAWNAIHAGNGTICSGESAEASSFSYYYPSQACKESSLIKFRS